MLIFNQEPGRVLLPAAGLAAYTLWLLAFPMKGQLILEDPGGVLLLAYLLPHIAALLLLAFAGAASILEGWQNAGIGLTMAGTLAFPVLAPEHAPAVMVLLGLSSAAVLLKVASVLRSSPNPPLSAAGGLALGNALLFLFLEIAPQPQVLAFLLAGLLAVNLQPGAMPQSSRTQDLYPYLPFVFAYYVISGLRYQVLQPDFSRLSLSPGFDLACYILAVGAAYVVYRSNRDLILVLGIFFGMLSLSLGFFPANAALRSSMICMQASVGFVDVFLLSLLLQQANYIRAFGLGIAVMCLGIAGGEAVAGYLQGVEYGDIIVGNGVLSVAVLILFLLGRENAGPKGDSSQVEALPGVRFAGQAELDSGGRLLDGLPPGLRSRLSPRERSILELVIQGRRYKDIARAMDISESSVKTYMRRVFEKAGVSDKQELMDRHFNGSCA